MNELLCWPVQFISHLAGIFHLHKEMTYCKALPPNNEGPNHSLNNERLHIETKAIQTQNYCRAKSTPDSGNSVVN